MLGGLTLPLQIQVTQDIKNPLLHRRELKVMIDHPETGTPTRTMVRDQVAAKLTQDKASVYVITLVTRSGTRKTYGRIHVYDEPRYGERLERPFIHLRNNPKSKDAGAEQSEEAVEAAPEKEAKPAKAPKEKTPKTSE